MRWPGAYAAFVLPKVGITDRKYTSKKLWTTAILSGKKFNSRQAKWAHTSVHNPDTPITQIFPTVLQFLLSWHKDPSTRSPQPFRSQIPDHSHSVKERYPRVSRFFCKSSPFLFTPQPLVTCLYSSPRCSIKITPWPSAPSVSTLSVLLKCFIHSAKSFLHPLSAFAHLNMQCPA